MKSITIWVCVDCEAHLANGECAGCPSIGIHEHDREPLSLLTDEEVSLGMSRDEHTCGYEKDEHSDAWQTCECERTTFSHSACEGCGSTLGGYRAAASIIDTRPHCDDCGDLIDHCIGHGTLG